MSSSKTVSTRSVETPAPRATGFNLVSFRREETSLESTRQCRERCVYEYPPPTLSRRRPPTETGWCTRLPGVIPVWTSPPPPPPPPPTRGGGGAPPRRAPP